GSDMIVMSTHGRTGLSHILVGSVTEKVVRQAHCRVLAIHRQPKEESKQIPAAVG
ncbi:MAG: universal stress protein, partial [Deltaproteobacteria bacterium]|nr:universal stress protein [Deltaproteobacteria bacterium]